MKNRHLKAASTLVAISLVMSLSAQSAEASSKSYSIKDCSSAHLLKAVRKFDKKYILSPNMKDYNVGNTGGEFVCMFETSVIYPGNDSPYWIQINVAPFSTTRQKTMMKGKRKGYTVKLGVGEKKAWAYEVALGLEGLDADVLAHYGNYLVRVKTQGYLVDPKPMEALLKTFIKK